MTETNSLALTALPNGFEDNNNLRLSVVLTPSISSDDGNAVAVKGTPFDGWTGKVQKYPPSWSVKLTAITGGSPIVLPAVSLEAKVDWRPDLWTAIFGGERLARNRHGNTNLRDSWRLTHNISDLHDRHRRLRFAQAQRALNTNMAKSAPADSVPKLSQVHTSLNEEVECHTPPVLYLFPTLKADSNDSSDASMQVDQRDAALTARSQIDTAAGVTADQRSKIQTRIDHALEILETQEGARLQAPALYCIYRHCVASVLPTGSLVEGSTVGGLYKAFTDAATPLIPAACSDSPDPVQAYQNYVEMLLFHRRKPEPKECTIDTPDFHQLLGMVNHYPAMLRPLALAFDLTVTLPAIFGEGVYLVQVSNPFNNSIFANMDVTSYQTQCEVHRGEKHFFSVSRDPDVVDRGYLALDAEAAGGGSEYSFSQEDADGSSLKYTDQANNAARASEYTSSAPTSMTTVAAANRFGLYPIAPTPTPSTNPTDAPPAARTVGLALFHQNRLATLEGIIQKAAPPAKGTRATPKDPGPLNAEDLMLGIRIDVKRGTRPWRSLCSRQSKYRVYFVDSRSAAPLEWRPEGGIELAADEGFVTFGATQSSLDDDSTQTQLHQSLFTWTGWSLAVPKPSGFRSMNPPLSHCGGVGPLTIDAKFELLPGAPLPALRFNDEYQVRCRVVDLAGNSVPCMDADAPHAIAVDPAFSRHEPIRAPQILLTEPIDRDRSPGENIAHLVARDGEEPASRVLVPPRESLRLAELHDLITLKNPLPESAFTRQNLMADGSFPSVQEAFERGWITGPVDDDCTNNQDAIFTKRKGAFEVRNPFYPDPLAHYIRVKPFLVSDDPTRSRPLGEGFYIEIDPLDDWPNFLATVVDLNARPDDEAPTVDYDNDARPPSITVNLPRSYTVVLEISSAGNSGENKSRRTDKSKSVALHQFEASRTRWLSNSSAGKRLLHDLIGADTKKAQNRHAELEKIVVDTRGQRTAANVLSDPNSYINGDLPQMTPPRTVTFVHAVRKPMEKPDFAPAGSAGDLAVRRARGDANAIVNAGIGAHWLSTGKITCHANWEDMIDDPKKEKPYRRRSNNVAFAVTASDTVYPNVPAFDGTTYVRVLKRGIMQVFPDTRAHDVTYSLSAATRFRSYYPLPPEAKPSNPPAPPADEQEYRVLGVTERKLTILSSVRPPAPSLAYIVPAFCWRDTYDPKTRTWFSGRDVLLRAYFERPFLISGDREGIGVVLAATTLSADDKTQALVSRWGSDPTKPITQAIMSSALTERNLCQPDNPVHACLLAEGGVANVKPCPVQFAEDRNLWFADIPMNTLGAFCPFVRLSLVRWQPEALHDFDPSNPPPAPVDPNIDARISGVVFADFIQISPNRWVSVQRRNDSVYVVTLSGVFPPPAGTAAAGSLAAPTITVSLFSRWYAAGKDSGWRPVDCKTQFNYTPAANDPPDPSASISSWSAEVRLPHSAAHRKYRILLQENEWFVNSKTPRVTYSQFVDLP